MRPGKDAARRGGDAAGRGGDGARRGGDAAGMGRGAAGMRQGCGEARIKHRCAMLSSVILILPSSRRSAQVMAGTDHCDHRRNHDHGRLTCEPMAAQAPGVSNLSRLSFRVEATDRKSEVDDRASPALRPHRLTQSPVSCRLAKICPSRLRLAASLALCCCRIRQPNDIIAPAMSPGQHGWSGDVVAPALWHDNTGTTMLSDLGLGTDSSRPARLTAGWVGLPELGLLAG